ncbi:unnamed protein product [Protopolystoma xenopodis]|uniref:Uncharacterized protein n=1 Tax=Protopolystoma xenopodis TaxID=117903 RepID=A0A3S5A6G9_9PLAT|nr:unnamed protein product [Protopolystoma xenopodis]
MPRCELRRLLSIFATMVLPGLSTWGSHVINEMLEEEESFAWSRVNTSIVVDAFGCSLLQIKPMSYMAWLTPYNIRMSGDISYLNQTCIETYEQVEVTRMVSPRLGIEFLSRDKFCLDEWLGEIENVDTEVNKAFTAFPKVICYEIEDSERQIYLLELEMTPTKRLQNIAMVREHPDRLYVLTNDSFNPSCSTLHLMHAEFKKCKSNEIPYLDVEIV